MKKKWNQVVNILNLIVSLIYTNIQTTDTFVNWIQNTGVSVFYILYCIGVVVQVKSVVCETKLNPSITAIVLIRYKHLNIAEDI